MIILSFFSFDLPPIPLHQVFTPCCALSSSNYSLFLRVRFIQEDGPMQPETTKDSIARQGKKGLVITQLLVVLPISTPFWLLSSITELSEAFLPFLKS